MEFSCLTGNADPSDRRLARLATRQHGVVASWQLQRLGYTRKAIMGLERVGHLIRLQRGVYAVGHTNLTAHGRWMAAVLAAGDGAVLSHADAAALHDLRRPPTGAIHVTTAGKRHIPGVRAHLGALPRTERTVCDAIPVTTVERTVADLAPTLPRRRLRTLIESAMRRDAIDFAVLRGIAGRRHGRPGGPALRAVLSQLHDVAPRIHQGLEAHFLDLVRAAGLPEPLVNHVVVGVEVDFHWPAQRVIVETDGWAFHRSRAAFEADRTRDATLLAAGWRVLRITHERLAREPETVVEQLRALLAA